MQSTGKLYYSIREVADLFKVNPSRLRFYEDEFPSLKPKKNGSGARIYTQADIDHIREIFELVESKGLKLPAARDHLQSKGSRKDVNRQYIAKLEKLKEFLVAMRDSL